MTVIFAAALADCAVIGADSQRTDLQSGAAWTVDKTVALSTSVAAAKFGYGGAEADQIWPVLMSLPETVRQDIGQLLGHAMLVGRPIYEERRSYFAERGMADYGLTLLFASYDLVRGAAVHWIDFKAGGEAVSKWRSSGDAAVVAQGPAGCQAIATSCATANLMTWGNKPALKVASWSADMVDRVSAADPEQTCGPPARYRLVDILGVSGAREAAKFSFSDIRGL